MNRRDAMKSLAAAALAPAAMPHAKFMRDTKPAACGVCCPDVRPVAWTVEFWADGKLIWKDSAGKPIVDLGNKTYRMVEPDKPMWIRVEHIS